MYLLSRNFPDLELRQVLAIPLFAGLLRICFVWIVHTVNYRIRDISMLCSKSFD